jgi:hypothetical protein
MLRQLPLHLFGSRYRMVGSPEVTGEHLRTAIARKTRLENIPMASRNSVPIKAFKATLPIEA